MASRLFTTALAVFLMAQAPLHAQQGEGEQPRGGRGAQGEQRPSPSAPAERLKPLPQKSVTQHRTGDIAFTATTGAIRIFDLAQGTPLVDVATIAFTRDDQQGAQRPVTFVFNGGPGYASAWLTLGALGPWRLRMDAEAAVPSASPATVDNPETWLAFTDLVFIDPPATGYSRIYGGDDVRKRFFSVDGDIDVLAATIRRWIEENNRMLSPKYIAGESYGGFRAPKLAHALQTDQGYGVSGLVMISPVLDFSRFNQRSGLLDQVARLPSYAASARMMQGADVTRAALADVESYARGEFLSDLMRGVKDTAALDRLTRRVSDLTTLDPALVRNLGGRIPSQVFLRELHRKTQRIGSAYDATVAGFDPTPFSPRSDADDQMRLGLHAPLVSAIVALYHDKLNWNVEGARYAFISEQASRQWDWGHGGAEAVSDFRKALALDPNLRVLIAHGLTDVVTPYLETQMVLDQMPNYGDPSRVKFETYSGGHMFYSRDESRKKFRDDARAIYVR
ncbi:MAG: peptidase [Hyphomicrobiales bacterium]|nr:peptidase [Hyphomicrobiales bacterium]